MLGRITLSSALSQRIAKLSTSIESDSIGLIVKAEDQPGLAAYPRWDRRGVA